MDLFAEILSTAVQCCFITMVLMMADGLNFVPTSRHTHTHMLLAAAKPLVVVRLFVFLSSRGKHHHDFLIIIIIFVVVVAFSVVARFYRRRNRILTRDHHTTPPPPKILIFPFLPASSPSLVRPLHDDNAAENPGSGRRIDVVVVTVVQQTIAAQTWLLCTNDAKFLPTASPPHDYHHHHHYMKLFFRVTSTHNGICTSSSIHITIIIITFTIFRNHQRELPRRFLFYDLSRNRFYLSSLSSD